MTRMNQYMFSPHQCRVGWAARTNAQLREYQTHGWPCDLLNTERIDLWRPELYLARPPIELIHEKRN